MVLMKKSSIYQELLPSEMWDHSAKSGLKAQPLARPEYNSGTKILIQYLLMTLERLSFNLENFESDYQLSFLNTFVSQSEVPGMAMSPNC